MLITIKRIQCRFIVNGDKRFHIRTVIESAFKKNHPSLLFRAFVESFYDRERKKEKKRKTRRFEPSKDLFPV